MRAFPVVVFLLAMVGSSSCAKGLEQAPTMPPSAPTPETEERATSRPFERPPPRGETFSLEQGASHGTESGLVVRYASHGHKHAAKGGRDAQMIYLEVTRGDERAALELRGSDDVLEGELEALGALLVVTGGYSGVTVTVSEPAPAPLTSDEARDLVDEAAARHGLRRDGSGSHAEDGLLHFDADLDGKQVWRARVGLYTRRVWFLRPGA